MRHEHKVDNEPPDMWFQLVVGVIAFGVWGIMTLIVFGMKEDPWKYLYF